MKDSNNYKTNSDSAAATERLGEKLGKRLKGGEVIELISDLGGGKTTFVRGLVRGAGSTDHVASPTFTINKIYKTPKLTIYHYDFYRLAEPGLIEYELRDILKDRQSVIIIEWSEVVRHVLPQGRIVIYIEPLGESTRNITIRVLIP